MKYCSSSSECSLFAVTHAVEKNIELSGWGGGVVVIILLSAMTSGEAAASGEAMAMSQMVKSVTWSSSLPSRRIVGIVLMAFPAKMIFDYNSIGGQTNIKKMYPIRLFVKSPSRQTFPVVALLAGEAMLWRERIS